MNNIEKLIEKAYKNNKTININDLFVFDFTKEEFEIVSKLLENNKIKIETYEKTKNIESASVDNSLDTYLLEIGKYPLLKSEEEKELIKLYRNGSKEAREKLICSNLRLVVSIAKRYASLYELSNVELLDLIQYGNLGLIKSIEKYDIERNTRLSTCAYQYINSEIQRGIENNESTIRIPVHIRLLLNRVKRFQIEYESKYGKEPNIDDYIDNLDCDKKTINILLLLPRNTQSLDMDISFGENGRIPLIETIKDDNSTVAIDKYINETYKEEIMEKVRSVLTEKEIKILLSRCGIDERGEIISKEKTLEEIGKELSITKEAVRQMQNKALKKTKGIKF